MTIRRFYRKESRLDYYADVPDDQGIRIDMLQTGCLMRIADATELMAKRYQELIDQRDMYKRDYERTHDTAQHLWRKINSLRGVITRLKKQNQSGKK